MKTSIFPRIAPRTGRRRGVTMIEVLLAVAIGAAIVISIVGFYLSGSESTKVNTHAQQIQKIAADTRSLYASRGDYTGLDNALAIQAGIVNNDMVAGTAIVNPWSGDVTLGTTASDRQFTLASDSMPEAACISLATSNMGSGALASLEINGSTVLDTVGGSDVDVTMADASSNCTADSANTITWTFR